jgi:Flp pilus assembly protein TadG
MRRDDRGTITVFVTVFMVALLVVAGLVIDGGTTLAARREAINVAESAARAGVQGLDEDAVRTASTVRLSPAAARTRVQNYLSLSGHTGTVTLEGDTVIVEVTITRPLHILGIAGLGTTTVTGRGSARGVRGVTQEGN